MARNQKKAQQKQRDKEKLREDHTLPVLVFYRGAVEVDRIRLAKRGEHAEARKEFEAKHGAEPYDAWEKDEFVG